MMDTRVWIGYGYELLTVMLPSVAVLLLYNAGNKRRNAPLRPRCLVWMIVFLFYLYGVFHFTGAGTVFDAKRYGLEWNPGRVNMLPFSDADFDPVGYVLNIFLFIPLGFLLPFIWQRFYPLESVLFAGLSFSALIEISQLLNSRSTDVDDIILNTAGALAGAVLFRFLSRFRMVRPVHCQNGWAAYAAIFFSFLCRFFLYDEMGLAKILYGF